MPVKPVKGTGDGVQSLIVLPQMFMQMLRVFYLPAFWIASAMLLLQIGYNVWRRERKIWKQKQVVYWLPAFLFLVLESYFSTMLSAVLGGVVAGILLLFIGVSLDLASIPYLWLVMVLLFCIQRRFVCFAYAGGVLALLQSIAGIFSFDVRQLLMLVAILHFTEAILVYISGAAQAYPVYLRAGQGRTICRTQLQRIWPIPLIMPIPLQHTQTALLQHGCIVMPTWWPLLNSVQFDTDVAMIYAIVPMLAVIGYQDIADCGKERQHTGVTAILLLVYSILLGGIVFFSSNYPALLGVAALFSIIGHEAIARL